MDVRSIFARSLYNVKGKVGIAVSGGRDSMALLDLFLTLNKKDVEVCAINVEHGIRGGESKADSQFVREYCQEKDIKLYSTEVDSLRYAEEQKMSVEQAARELRLAYFRSLLANGVVDHIALAHHADDQYETIFMRIMRGTGVDGLVGMKQSESFIRPLLQATRDQIDEYVRQNDIPYREDSTNTDPKYTRNYLRNELFPELEKRWNYRRSLQTLQENSAELVDLLDSLKLPTRFLDDGVPAIDVAEWRNYHPAVIKHSIRRAMANFNGAVDFEKVNLQAVLDLLDKPNGKSVDLAGGVRAWKEYDKLVFDKVISQNDFEIPFSIGVFELFGSAWEICPRCDERLRFDISKIPDNAVIRTAQAGDVFCKFGGFTLPLGDFYTDKKISVRLRKKLPIIAVGNEVLVTAIEISQKVVVEDGGYTLRRLIK